MKLLLDTHVIIWWLTASPELSPELKEHIMDEVDVYISPASPWEIVIKQATGKLRAPDDLAEQVRDAGFVELPISTEHGIAAGRLPLFHRDPFDRMLIAQAKCENLTLVTRDEEIHKYDVRLLRA